VFWSWVFYFNGKWNLPYETALTHIDCKMDIYWSVSLKLIDITLNQCRNRPTMGLISSEAMHERADSKDQEVTPLLSLWLPQATKLVVGCYTSFFFTADDLLSLLCSSSSFSNYRKKNSIIYPLSRTPAILSPSLIQNNQLPSLAFIDWRRCLSNILQFFSWLYSFIMYAAKF
jgi:hypothetical protein